MPKTKILNLVDIFKLKKDLLWGKYYYALLDQGKLLDTILYSYAYANRELIEIHEVEMRTKELLKDFTGLFARKKNIRYFIRELDEKSQIADIEFMNDCGFKRFTRNYCYEYDGLAHSLNERPHLNVFCREIYEEDIPKLVEHDIDSQILEYRDALHRSYIFFKSNFENIFVFCNSQNMNEIYAFCFKRSMSMQESFEFIIHPRQASQIGDFIYAFAEKFVYFDKYSTQFNFTINESLNQAFKDQASSFNLLSSTQMLIYEGRPRESSKAPNSTLEALALNTSALGAKS